MGFERGDVVTWKNRKTTPTYIVDYSDKFYFRTPSGDTYSVKDFKKIGKVFMFELKMKVVHKRNSRIVVRIIDLWTTAFRGSDDNVYGIKDFKLFKNGWEHGITVLKEE